MANREDKGKAKADPSTDTTSTADTSPDRPSLASRIGTSATSLARDVVSRPSGASVTSTLSSTATGSEKPRLDPSAAGAVSGESSTWAQGGLRGSGLDARSRLDDHADQQSFRGQSASNDIPRDHLVEEHAAEYGLHNRTHPDSAYGQARDQTTTEDGSSIMDATHGPAAVSINGAHWSQAEQSDGVEVAQLLSDPRLDTDDSLESVYADNAEEPSAQNLFGPDDPSVDQQGTRRMINDILPPPPSHPIVNSQAPQNLESEEDQFRALEQEYKEYKEWLDAMRNYTDDVWGPDLPQLREAREQVRQIEEEDHGVPNERALRRLGMLLRHIKPARSD
ncbi:MAG: hypothetical protein M1828_001191 [Chrysothrix sp. TS-e1954]|nr:MAG: hypothetical protein M1828_001191 [Chrysothrix sp. TS-e1954]